MMRIHIKPSPAFELQFPYFDNVVIVSVKCSVNCKNMNSLLPSLHWGPSHPSASQLRFPHPSTTMQPALPSPPPLSYPRAFAQTVYSSWNSHPPSLPGKGLLSYYDPVQPFQPMGSPWETEDSHSAHPPHCPCLSQWGLLHLVMELSPP